MTQVTQDGYDRLVAKREALEERLAELLAGKAEAAEVGGNVWHDNASFEQIELQERMLRGQLARLNTVLERATLVRADGGSRGCIAIGSTAEIEQADGEVQTWRIGGHGESDPLGGVIAYDTPLGATLLGARVGEVRSFVAGGRERAVTVLRIDGEEAVP